jgi:myosin-5
VKTGLSQVESWIMEHGAEWVGESWEELKFIRQAVTFLVIGNKPKKSLEDITRDLCPVLSIQQLYRISTMYWDDTYNTETVSSEVRRGCCLRGLWCSNCAALPHVQRVLA